jgi:hypothetical protein
VSSRRKFIKGIIDEYGKIKHRFEEIEEDIKKSSEESTEKERHNVELKERYLKQMIVHLWFSIALKSSLFKPLGNCSPSTLNNAWLFCLSISFGTHVRLSYGYY